MINHFLIFTVSVFAFWACKSPSPTIHQVQPSFTITPVISNSEFKRGDSLYLKIINTSAYPIKMSSPRYYANMLLNFTADSGQRAYERVRIKADFSNKKSYVEVASMDSVTLTYDYLISYLFDLKQGMWYNLKLNYSGDIFINRQKTAAKMIFESPVVFKD